MKKSYFLFILLLIISFMITDCGNPTVVLPPPTEDLVIVNQAPGCGSINITVNTSIVVVFNKEIDQNSENFTGSIIVQEVTDSGTEPVNGSVFLSQQSSNTIIFEPAQCLKQNTIYRYTIKKDAVVSKDGHSLSEDFSCAFITGDDSCG